MEKFMSKMMQLVKDEEGATMVEYALMVALIAVTLIGVVTLLAGGIDGVFSAATTALDNSVGATTP